MAHVDIRVCYCEECTWWIGFETGEGKSLGYGQCRRFPPTQTKYDEKGFHAGIWPVTEADDSCGEFSQS